MSIWACHIETNDFIANNELRFDDFDLIICEAIKVKSMRYCRINERIFPFLQIVQIGGKNVKTEHEAVEILRPKRKRHFLLTVAMLHIERLLRTPHKINEKKKDIFSAFSQHLNILYHTLSTFSIVLSYHEFQLKHFKIKCCCHETGLIPVLLWK